MTTRASRKPTSRKRASKKKPPAKKRTSKRARPSKQPKRRKSDPKGSTRHTPNNVVLPDPAVPKVLVGRPRKISDETNKLVYDALLQGNYVETALAYAGLSRQTGYDAMRRGRLEIQRVEQTLADSGNHDASDEEFAKLVKPFERVYVEFSYMIEKALAFAEMRDVKKLHDYTEKVTTSGQAAALQWRLERRFRKRWEKNDKALEVDITAGDTSVGIKYTEIHGVGKAANLAVEDLERRDDADDQYDEDMPT